MGLTYRKAVIEESGKIADIYNEFLYNLRDISNEIYFDFNELSKVERENLIADRFDEDKGLIVVAEDDGEIIGFISMTLMNCFMIVSSVKTIGYIEAGYVRPEYRKMGVIKHLESMVVDFLREKNIRFLELFTLMDNEIANKSWGSLGYEPFRMQWRKDLDG